MRHFQFSAPHCGCLHFFCDCYHILAIFSRATCRFDLKSHRFLARGPENLPKFTISNMKGLKLNMSAITRLSIVVTNETTYFRDSALLLRMSSNVCDSCHFLAVFSRAPCRFDFQVTWVPSSAPRRFHNIQDFNCESCQIHHLEELHDQHSCHK